MGFPQSRWRGVLKTPMERMIGIAVRAPGAHLATRDGSEVGGFATLKKNLALKTNLGIPPDIAHAKGRRICYKALTGSARKPIPSPSQFLHHERKLSIMKAILPGEGGGN